MEATLATIIAAAAPLLFATAGETISDSGAIDQTGVTTPVSRPAPSRTGSLYQRLVNGPGARRSASVIRASHFTLLVP